MAMVSTVALQLVSLLSSDGWRYGIAICITARGRWLALWHCSSHRCSATMVGVVALQLASPLDNNGDGWHYNSRRCLVAMGGTVAL
jgi:hypothetical protein